MRHSIRALFVLPALLALAACQNANPIASQQAALTNLIGDVPALVSAVLPGAPPVLSAAAQLACTGQQIANQNNDAVASAYLGAACKW